MPRTFFGPHESHVKLHYPFLDTVCVLCAFAASLVLADIKLGCLKINPFVCLLFLLVL